MHIRKGVKLVIFSNPSSPLALITQKVQKTVQHLPNCCDCSSDALHESTILIWVRRRRCASRLRITRACSSTSSRVLLAAYSQSEAHLRFCERQAGKVRMNATKRVVNLNLFVFEFFSLTFPSCHHLVSLLLRRIASQFLP